MSERTVIVGAGVAGLVAALVAQRTGQHVTVVEADQQVGGFWTSRETTLGDKTVLLDRGLRLPVMSGIDTWDEAIFFNAEVDFEWRIFDGWPHESSIFAGGFSAESSCVDARALGPEMLTKCIESMECAQSAGVTPDGADAANDFDFVSATYGDAFARSLFEPIVNGILGASLSSLAPGTAQSLIPRRLIMCEANDMDAFISRHPSLARFLAHSRHAALPASAAKRFLYPKQGGISSWINALYRHLKRIGVEFSFSDRVSQISPNGDTNTTITLASGLTLTTDNVFWTVPPVMLMQSLPNITQKVDRPELLTLGVHHVLMNRDMPDVTTQYLLNFEESPTFFRAVFWDNIRATRDRVITFEILKESLSSVAGEATAAANACVEQLIACGALPEDLEVVADTSEQFSNYLPRITPHYRMQTNQFMAEVRRSAPFIHFVGRAAGNSLFLDEIIREIVMVTAAARDF